MANQPIFDRPLEQLFTVAPKGSGSGQAVVVPVPNLNGLSFDAALRALQQAPGRLLLTKGPIVIEAGEEDVVRDQQPKAGEFVPPGSRVTVTVRRNPDPQDPTPADILVAVADVKKGVSALPGKVDVAAIVENELNGKLPTFRKQVDDALAASGLSAADVQRVQDKLDEILRNTGGTNAPKK